MSSVPVIPRGIRNNNPGNIRKDGTDWLGLDPNGADPDFCVFTKPEYGIRAIARILLNYQREGITSIQEAIDKWAPPTENDTDAYVKAVCAQCNVAGDKVVDFRSIMPQLVAAIIQHENGQQPYTPGLITYGVSLA